VKNIISIVLGMILFSNVYSNTFHIDPINGSNSGNGTISSPWKTLEEVISTNLIESKSYLTPYDANNPQLIIKNAGAPIKAGDTLVLYSGLHGEIYLVNYINDQNINVINAQGNIPIFKKLHIQAGKNWIFNGIDISSEPYNSYLNDKLVFLESHDWQGPVSNIKIENCNIYSTTTAWTDTTNWITKASDGIVIKGDSINIIDNNFSNVHFGVSMRGDYILSSGNSITNFSGDGIRLVGSNNIVEKNIIKNCYAVDSNHDDGIQSFTTGGLVVDNNIVRQNTILNYEDPNQALLGDLQGIGCFDGPFHNWIVENNLIVVNHWHGISFYGFINGKIINNTVLDPAPTLSPGPTWIKVEDDAGNPSSACVVMNNVANTISVTANTTVGNNTTLQTLSDYASNFVDYSNDDFHLIQTSSLIDAADITIAPAIDLEGNTRPSGPFPDIGAYEYQFSLSIEDIDNQIFKIYPNPFVNYVEIVGKAIESEISIYDVNGRLVKKFNNISIPSRLNLNNLKNGMYFVEITDKLYNIEQTRMVVKSNY
jgi:hypothetical protein